MADVPSAGVGEQAGNGHIGAVVGSPLNQSQPVLGIYRAGCGQHLGKIRIPAAEVRIAAVLRGILDLSLCGGERFCHLGREGKIHRAPPFERHMR